MNTIKREWFTLKKIQKRKTRMKQILQYAGTSVLKELDVDGPKEYSQKAWYIWLLGLYIKPSIPTDFARAKGTCWGQRKESGMRK